MLVQYRDAKRGRLCDRTGCRTLYARDHLEQCGLSRPVATDNPPPFTFGNGESDVLKEGRRAKFYGRVRYGNESQL